VAENLNLKKGKKITNIFELKHLPFFSFFPFGSQRG